MVLLILIGAIFLLFAITPIKKVSNLLRDEALQFRWNILKFLVILFIIGYLYYSYEYWSYYSKKDSVNFVVPLIFFFGGVFVYLVGLLASTTAQDIIKIASLERENITDELMQIHNRRHFDKKLKEKILLSSRYSLPLSLLIIDLDNFKRVNDSYGHLIGDSVLQGVAKIIKEVVRDVDIIARYGGEEIAIITPNIDINQATALAQRVREKIECTDISIECSTIQSLKVTVSIGVASLNNFYEGSYENIIKDADKALYRAKKEGRNLVIAAK